MSFLPRKGLLAIAAVVDVALNGRDRPVSARHLAARHHLPTRHLEPVLQALVHDGIFNGVRGPRGGYQLARERKRITVAEILRAAGSVTEDEDAHTGSRILEHAVVPSLADAERAFASALSRLSLDEIVRRAETLPAREFRAVKNGDSISVDASSQVVPGRPSHRGDSTIRSGAVSREFTVHGLDSYGASHLEVKVL